MGIIRNCGMKNSSCRFLGALLLTILLFASCAFSDKPVFFEEKPESVEYPVGYIAQKITTALSDTIKLYPLSEEFLANFMQMCTQYDGAHPTVAAEFPKEWGVALVERLPEGRELYQIQSLNREWVFLVATSGYGTPRILDMLPVAVNLAIQTQGILETEIWTAEKELSGTLTVTKKYEWVRSLENVSQKEYDENPQNFLRSKTIIDKYTINDAGHFEIVPTEDIPDYSVVIFYIKNEKPENWDDIVEMLHSFCEDYSILFAEVRDNFNRFSLFDYKLNFITDLDLTPYTELPAGVIFMKKDEMSKTVPFGSYERLKIEIKRYFKIVEA
jgi:hypothetical protein